MRFLLILGIYFLSSVTFAGEHTWYVMNKFECSLSNGTKISHNQSRNPDMVISTLGVFSKMLYIDGTYYDQDLNLSVIGFTGHKPSAGPSLDPWESSYSMRFGGLLPLGSSAGIEGEIYRDAAYTGWVRMPVTVKCNVLVERTF